MVNLAYASCDDAQTIQCVKVPGGKFEEGNPQIPMDAVAQLAEVPRVNWQAASEIELESSSVAEGKPRIKYIKYQYGTNPAEAYYYSWSESKGSVYSKTDPKAKAQ